MLKHGGVKCAVVVVVAADERAVDDDGTEMAENGLENEDIASTS